MREFNLTLPEGPVKYIYYYFVTEEELPELHWASPYGGGKSSAVADFLALNMAEYPGINAVLARGTLADLRRSTLDRVKKRHGFIFDAQNENQGIYRGPEELDPVTGAKVRSTLWALGLNRVDLEHLVKSTEFGAVAIEEADEVNMDGIDYMIGRMRQQVFHKRKTMWDMAIRKSKIWGIVPEEAYEILASDHNNSSTYKRSQDHPMPIQPMMRLAWNPSGANEVWQRAMGVPYPEHGVTPEFVKKYIGIREVHVDHDTIKKDFFKFTAGSIIFLADDPNERFFAMRQEGKDVYLINPDPKTGRNNPKKVSYDDCNLIVQRGAVYSFPWQNQSRMQRNVEISYLMTSSSLRERVMHGRVSPREGYVFPAFVNDYKENGGHIIPYPGKDVVSLMDNKCIMGLDDGLDHACAAVWVLITKETRTAIVFDEYVKSGQSAVQNAYDIASMKPLNMQVTCAYDPAMNKRENISQTLRTVADEYGDVFKDYGITMIPGQRGPQPFDLMNSMFEFKERGIALEKTATLYVTDNCKQFIETCASLKWINVRNQRGLWTVDMGDAGKLAASIIPIFRGQTSEHVERLREKQQNRVLIAR